MPDNEQTQDPDAGCYRCGATLPADSEAYAVRIFRRWEPTDTTVTFCEACFEHYTFECARCEGVYRQSERTSGPGDDSVCLRCRREDTTACCACGERYYSDDITYSPSEGPYCESCFDNEFTSCENCGEPVHNSAQTCDSCLTRPLPDTTFERLKYRGKVGFEVECIVSDSPDVPACANKHDDGSLSGSGNEFGVELVSRPGAGDSVLSAVDAICKSAKDVGGYVNQTCGFHVHIDMSTHTDTERNRVFHWFRSLERIFYAVTSPNRRTNGYCKSVATAVYPSPDRYHSLNVAAFIKHGTFEIRLHQGTLNPEKMKQWIIFLTSFFDTFSRIPFDEVREKALMSMTDRERLLFVMLQTKMPLSLAKYLVKRIRTFNEREFFFYLDSRRAA